LEHSKFLVTGGAGFIGSNLCEALLDKGFFVRVLDDFSTGKRENIETFLSNPKFDLVEGDIRDFDTCMNASADVDFVLHQAAWGSVPRSIKMPLVYEEVNIRGTLNMLEAARLNNIKKFVYASSSSVYGDSPSLPKIEGKEGKVLSPYALTKYTCEQYAALYTSLYGLDTYGLRYFNVFGRRQNPDGDYAAAIPKFIKNLLQDTPSVIHGDGMQSRDFTYIENVIDANLKACAAPPKYAGNVFNVAYGGQVELLSVYEELCKLLNKDIPPILGPPRKGDIRHSNADISKAKQMLKYAPAYDFYQGIKLCVAWYKELFENEVYAKHI